jgi:phage gp36-like protein
MAPRTAAEFLRLAEALYRVAQSRVRDGTDRARRRYALALAWLREVEKRAQHPT